MGSYNNPPPPPGSPDPYSNGDENGQTLDSSAPAVAAAPTKVMFILGGMVLFLLFMLYQIFIKPESNEAPTEPNIRNIAKDTPPPNIADIGTQLPPAPVPPILPPEIPDGGNLQPIDSGNDAPTNELLRQRQRSAMVIVNGGGGLLGALSGDDGDEMAGTDPNMDFANRVAKSNTKAPKVTATHIGALKRTIAQGKLIFAVLETAINTDLPGPIRAIVSRDIFPEDGDNPLIPKGSRLVGTYNSNILGGQRRVYVVWTRVIRPDGVDVMINSPLVDQIGMSGVAGAVDTRFGEIFSRALLTSVVGVSLALAAEQVTGDEGEGRQSGSNNTFFSGSRRTTDDAIVESIDGFGATTAAFLQRYINVKPTILVDQGTPVNVFVNRDLIFPSEYTGARIID